jgi:hypothetical protein
LQGKRVDQVLGESVSKIFVGAVTEIGEGKHSHDRGSILSRQVRGVPGLTPVAVGAAWLPSPDIDRLFDVLQTVTAGVDKGGAEMLAGLTVGLC